MMTSSRRRIDTALIGNLVVIVALAALAIALTQWQAEPIAWIAPGRERVLAAAGLLAAYVGFVAGLAWVRAKRNRSRTVPAAAERGDVLVAGASQTGHADELAHRTWLALREGGVRADLAMLGRLNAQAIAQYPLALFVASTTGEGDAPDPVAAFVRRTMSASADLSALRYGVLALGDREYAQFCRFGHDLDRWLRHAGAQPLFDVIEVDNGDAGALRHWQHHIGLLAGRTDLPDWSPPSYRPWRLAERRRSNPGSVGGPAFHLALVPRDDEALDWQAGDIAEIGPRNSEADVAAWLARRGFDAGTAVHRDGEALRLADLLQRSHLPAAHEHPDAAAQAIAEALVPLPHREYSIASLPADGALHLLVRQMQQADGRLGVGSGWLTEHAALDATIDLRVRTNASFHAPSDARPLVLIGNGTGIAGLRSLLKARIAAGHRRNWLLFGERQAACDLHYREDVERWQRDGMLERLDLAFSRDGLPDRRVYVQDRLRERIGPLREWIAQGAAVYVCGSLDGMAPGVDAVLREAVGLDALETMALDGRYRRDVY